MWKAHGIPGRWKPNTAMTPPATPSRANATPIRTAQPPTVYMWTVKHLDSRTRQKRRECGGPAGGVAAEPVARTAGDDAPIKIHSIANRCTDLPQPPDKAARGGLLRLSVAGLLERRAPALSWADADADAGAPALGPTEPVPDIERPLPRTGCGGLSMSTGQPTGSRSAVLFAAVVGLCPGRAPSRGRCRPGLAGPGGRRCRGRPAPRTSAASGC